MRKHHAFGKIFLPSVLLHFDNQGSLAPCVRKRAYLFLFFSVLPRIRTSDRDERKHIILTWDRLGEITLGGIKETGKSGRQMYWEVKHEIFTTYYYDTAGNFLQGLSYPSSNQFKSNPLGLLRYLHIVRTKNWDMDKRIEIRAGWRMGKRGDMTQTCLYQI